MKKFFELIKELMKSPRGKAILFFSFYFIFFLFIAILARITPNSNNKTINESEQFSLSMLNGTNYSYRCNVTIDNNNALIEGIKNGENEKFTYKFNNIQNTYYKNNLIYYLNGQTINRPEWYFNLIDNIDYIVNSATYDAVTNYQSGRVVLRYILSSATLSNLIDNKDLDIEEIPNEISIIKNNDRVEEIDIVFSSYCISTNKCVNNGKLSILYNDFGKIEAIN